MTWISEGRWTGFNPWFHFFHIKDACDYIGPTWMNNPAYSPYFKVSWWATLTTSTALTPLCGVKFWVWGCGHLCETTVYFFKSKYNANALIAKRLWIGAFHETEASRSVGRIREGPGTPPGSLIALIEKLLSEQPAGGTSGIWNPIWSGVEIWPRAGLE